MDVTSVSQSITKSYLMRCSFMLLHTQCKIQTVKKTTPPKQGVLHNVVLMMVYMNIKDYMQPFQLKVCQEADNFPRFILIFHSLLTKKGSFTKLTIASRMLLVCCSHKVIISDNLNFSYFSIMNIYCYLSTKQSSQYLSDFQNKNCLFKKTILTIT